MEMKTMKPRAKAFFVILAIGLLTACAAPLKVTPTRPAVMPDNFIKAGASQDLAEQLRLNDPKYTLNFPDGVELSKAFYSAQGNRLYIPAKSNGQFEYMAINLSDGKILWMLKLPKNTILYKLKQTSSGDLWLDANCHGYTLAFLNPDTGEEKWRYGAGAAEKQPLPFRYFQTDKYNVFLGGNAIFVQDPTTYQMISTADRYATDLQGSNAFKGNTLSFAPFYNTHVIDYENQFLVVDHGLHAYSKQTGQKLWSARFPTIATQFHTGENVGKMFAGAFLGALTGVYVHNQRSPDVAYPKTLVAATEQYYYVSALSNLYCVNKATGVIEWAEELNLGYANLLDASAGRIYLISVGNYENAVCSIDKENGTIMPCAENVSAKKVVSQKLALDTVANMKEGELWQKHSACYDAMAAKQKLTTGDKQLLAAVSLPEKIAILAKDGIYFLNKADGAPAGNLPNPIDTHAKVERIMALGENSMLAVSTRSIACIDTETLETRWNLDLPWALKTLDQFYLNSMSDQFLYLRAIVDKTIKACVVDKKTGVTVQNFEASQTLYDQNFLAIQNDRRVSIYLGSSQQN